MDFKEFTTRAEQDIRAALEDASPGVGVGMNQVEKLQGESYTAITLTPEGTNIGMNLNLNQLYDRMQHGESYDSILQAAVDQAKEHLSNMPRFDVAELSSYETAKDLLFVDVVGTKVNAEMLAKVPHTDMEDTVLCISTPMKTASANRNGKPTRPLPRRSDARRKSNIRRRLEPSPSRSADLWMIC